MQVAKILYGVMGNTHGHVMRTLSIVSRMAGHEFVFVGGGRVPDAMRAHGHRVHEVPVLRTVHRKQHMAFWPTVGQIVSRVAEIPSVKRGICDLIDEWQPDVAITDREFFLPLAAQSSGLECLSIDHSHVMKACQYPVPRSEWFSWGAAMVNDYLLFDFTRRNLVVSFFHPPKKPGSFDELLPPVLRQAVTAVPRRPAGDYIFVYQTSATFVPLIETLRRLKRTVIIYGFRNEAATEGNLIFKPYHPTEILEDLAGSAYAVVNGGHNLICEALYFGKPVLCFPIKNLFEQFINAWHVRALGYGDFSQSLAPQPELFEAFECNVERYRQNVESGFVDGTETVVKRLEDIIAGA
jgi:uncharacterized protein (TIGR00661 family)